MSNLLPSANPTPPAARMPRLMRAKSVMKTRISVCCWQHQTRVPEGEGVTGVAAGATQDPGSRG